MANCARLIFWFLLWWLQAIPTQGAMAVARYDSCSDSFTRTALIAAATANPTYDKEGNLAQDSLWSYTWDGQNRLIQMESGSGVPAAQPRVKLRFTYDAQGRRIRKQVWQETWTAQSSVRIYTLKSDRRFLYDGWNLIAEIDPDGTPARTYLWGTDLSGSGQGAGGVGGLLAISILKGPAAALGTHYPSYDANGNIIALTNGNTGQETAHYSYEAFGQELRASGPAAQANPFHFSTKFTDEETGLVYYGYRYLDPASSKWISRDPIHERGGLNVYGFVANNSITDFDALGLSSWTDAYVREWEGAKQGAGNVVDAFVDVGKALNQTGAWWGKRIGDAMFDENAWQQDVDAVKGGAKLVAAFWGEYATDKNKQAQVNCMLGTVAAQTVDELLHDPDKASKFFAKIGAAATFAAVGAQGTVVLMDAAGNAIMTLRMTITEYRTLEKIARSVPERVAPKCSCAGERSGPPKIIEKPAAAGVATQSLTALEELQALGPLENMSAAQIEQMLSTKGYSRVTGGNGGSVWTKAAPDGNTAAVRIDPATVRPKPKGFADEVPHVHKEVVPTSNVSNENYPNGNGVIKLDDTGTTSSLPSATHIPGGH